MGKINIVACGGGGINIAHDVKTGMADMPYSNNLVVYGIDTSDANATKIDSANFTKMASRRAGDKELRGSGAEQTTNLDIVRDGVILWMKDKDIVEPNGEVFVVVHSMSGGSGSIIGPLLVKELLKRDIPTLVVSVSDSKDLLSAKNSSRILKNYHNIANQLGKVVSMIHYDNNKHETLSEVNEYITGNIFHLNILYSGENESLDEADIEMFLNPSSYNQITVPAGVNIIKSFGGEYGDNFSDMKNIALARVLNTDTVDITPITAKHVKAGVITDQSVIDAIGEDHVPLTMISTTGVLQSIVAELDKKIKKMDTALALDDISLDDDGVVL